MKKVFFLFLFFLIINNSECLTNNCAVVTLVYKNELFDNSFSLGAATLGRSLVKHDTRMTMIALITPFVTSYEKEMLHAEGWETRLVKPIENPNENHIKRFSQIYTKLNIFSMVDFDRVVYLDADTIVTSNIDELCNCNAVISAVVRNTFFNAGVIVVTPILELYEDMINSIESVPSYESGDQGFLNAYFWNMERCPYYDPLQDMTPHLIFPENNTLHKCLRIPAHYNGDVAIYVARGNSWIFDPDSIIKQPRIIHFTMAFFKPWDWWSYIIVNESWKWLECFYEVDSSSLIIETIYFILISIPFTIILVTLSKFNVSGSNVITGIFSQQSQPDMHGAGKSMDIYRSIFMFHIVELLCIGCAYYISTRFFFDPYLNAVIFIAYNIILSIFHMLFWSKKWGARQSLPKSTRNDIFDISDIGKYSLVTIFVLTIMILFLFINFFSIYIKAIIFFFFILCYHGIYKTTVFMSLNKKY